MCINIQKVDSLVIALAGRVSGPQPLVDVFVCFNIVISIPIDVFLIFLNGQYFLAFGLVRTKIGRFCFNIGFGRCLLIR